MLNGFLDLTVVVALGFVLVAGVGFVLVVGGRIGSGSPTVLAGLFPAHGVRDWPTGVQEPDAPRFDVAHLDALRHGVVVVPGAPDVSADASCSVEIVELEQTSRIALERVAMTMGRDRPDQNPD